VREDNLVPQKMVFIATTREYKVGLLDSCE